MRDRRRPSRRDRARPRIDILKFYFPGLTVGHAATDRRSRPPRRRDRAPAPQSRHRPLPATSRWRCRAAKKASERQRAVADSPQPRRDRESRPAPPPPARLRVTVHPSVDSFGRATGQPWWVSGATDGPAIDLLPITMLRQQGQLDRTIRHEVTHALLDGALAKRPMWVREGAAAYFAAAGQRASDKAGARGVSRPMRNCCARFQPARSAMRMRAPKPASRARSPKASAGIRFGDALGDRGRRRSGIARHAGTRDAS